MRKWALVFLMVILAFMVSSASGQVEPAVSAMEIDLWPEYDHPEMLVIYKLTLSRNTPPPAEIRLRIPAYVGEPNAVAMRQVDGGLVNLVYTRVVEGDWAWIELTAPVPEIQVEYYDAHLKKDGANRSFVYQWKGDVAVDSLVVKIQQPFGAASLRVSPDLGKTVSGSNGFSYYEMDIGSVKKDQVFEINLDYIKENDALSIEGLKVKPSAPITQEIKKTAMITAFLPWLLGVLGILLLVSAVVWYWKSEKEVMGARPRRIRRVKRGDDQTIRGFETSSDSLAVYCHQCGKRAVPGDRFCRSCGTKLKG